MVFRNSACIMFYSAKQLTQITEWGCGHGYRDTAVESVLPVWGVTIVVVHTFLSEMPGSSVSEVEVCLLHTMPSPELMLTYHCQWSLRKTNLREIQNKTRMF